MSEARKAQIAAAEAAAADGRETPLEYMLRVMRDEGTDEKRRDAMAMGAAPYIHPRLAAVELGGDKDNPIRVEHSNPVDRPPRETREDWERRRANELMNGVGSAARPANGSH